METDDDVIDLLKLTIPFQILPDYLLKEVAKIVRRASFEKGEVIYEVGASANDIYIIASGEVEHAFDPDTAVATNLVKVVGRGAVFGWAALFKEQPAREPRHRLAKTTCLQPTEALIVGGDDLFKLLETDASIRDKVMARFTTMVSREYGFVGFVKVRGELIPARISHTGNAAPSEYDTFGF